MGKKKSKSAYFFAFLESRLVSIFEIIAAEVRREWVLGTISVSDGNQETLKFPVVEIRKCEFLLLVAMRAGKIEAFEAEKY